MDRQHFERLLDGVRETRARVPEVLRNRHSARRRRSLLGRGSRTLLVDAMPPDAGALALWSEARALADRPEYLYRLCLSQYAVGVDGVIAASDTIDDLLLLEVLNDRVVVASLTGAPVGGGPHVRFSGYDAHSAVDMRLEGGYLRFPMTPSAMASAAYDRLVDAVNTLGTGNVAAVVEPTCWYGDDSGMHPDASVDAHVTALAALAATGARSHALWAIVPYGDGPDQVRDLARASLIPLLLRFAPEDDIADRERVLAALRTPGVRGAVVSSATLYPPSGHPCARLEQLGRLVHMDDTNRP